MEVLLNRDHFNRYYNCTFYDYNTIPVEGRRNFVVGIVLLVLYVVFEILYLPCLGVFARKENRRESCYKLMLFMGLLSMVNINSSGLIIGIYAARGDVFCSRPLFNYLIGMPAFGLYCAESLVAVMLALNRCIEMWDHRIAEKLFERHKVNYWIGGAILYGLALGIGTIPPVPNGMLVGWFWNPHILYAEDKEGVYQNILFTLHNISIGFGLPLIYATFYVLMRRKMSLVVNQCQQQSKERRKSKVNVFLQVLLIGALHMFCTLLYVYMQYFYVPIWVVMSASYAWIASQGLVPVIYIIFNKYIRRSIKALFVDPALLTITRVNTRTYGPNSVATRVSDGAVNPQNNGNSSVGKTETRF